MTEDTIQSQVTQEWATGEVLRLVNEEQVQETKKWFRAIVNRVFIRPIQQWWLCM